MKILETRDAFLSDYEVYKFLSDLQEQHRWTHVSKGTRRPRAYNHPELQSITHETLKYLGVNKNFVPQEGDEANGDENNKHSTEAAICRFDDRKFEELVRKLNDYHLFKGEKLQIVNQLPTNMVSLYAIVEECDSRFTEQEIEGMIALISQYA